MERIDRLKLKANNLTDKPGVYLMKNKTNCIIYVGKAKSLKNRVSSYFRNLNSHTKKVEKMIDSVDDFDFIVTDTEEEALVLECSLIKQYSPRYNILLKDDKGYSYILITDEVYPRIKVAKQNEINKGEYIGPFISSFVVKQTVEEVNRVFKLPTCNIKLGSKKLKRPCLNYYINKCTAPCINKISKEEYDKTIKEAINYIKTGSEKSVKTMEKEMEIASKNEDFELALTLRDRIKAIKKSSQNQKIFIENKSDIDIISSAKYNDNITFVILKFRGGRLVDKVDYTIKEVTNIENVFEDFVAGYYSNEVYIPKIIVIDKDDFQIELYRTFLENMSGHKVYIKIPIRGKWKDIIKMAHENATEILAQKFDKKGRDIEALYELGKILNLNKTPIYIEAYDISNLGDSGIVGGMVVFENGVPNKKNYRKFAIKEVYSRDDYASMREMLKRRIVNYKENKEGFNIKPDLILIDGGQGHIRTIEGLLRDMDFNVSAYGMVKDNKHRTRAIATDGGEISLVSYKTAFKLLTRIQDEVHRYTISYQKKVRNKSSFNLELTKIDGIGEKKAKDIIRHFKSKTALKNADEGELAKIAKVSLEKAREIILFMNSI